MVAACALALSVGGGERACATTGMGMDIDLAGQRPSDLGRTADGQYLKLCNADWCISSSEPVGSKHYLPPWTFNDDGRAPVARSQAMTELLAVLEQQPDITVVSRADDYLLCEARRGIAMVDDVEFLFSPNQRDLEIRSASRVFLPPDRNQGRLDKILSELSTKYPRWHAQKKKCAMFLYNEKAEFEYCDSPDSTVFSAPTGAAQFTRPFQ